MLNKELIELLKNSKNLLAFSAGGDSTALLHILLENQITFDIAIVDYGVRKQSKDEVAYARELAQLHGLTCFVKTAPKIEKNFEAQARTIRYDFFETLIERNGYENLLTAHHLGDRLEWFLMQFCKGSGAVELSGMQEIESRENYKLVRPLLDMEKKELLAYLNAKEILYFEDESNEDQTYKRNYFRHNYAQPLLENYAKGIKKSFEYMTADKERLIKEYPISHLKELHYFQYDDQRAKQFTVDRYLKTQGHMITASEKRALLEEQENVIGRKYLVSQTDTYCFIAPYKTGIQIPKELKERFRVLKVPVKLRAYLAEDEELVALVSSLLQ
ncbi:MAG: tRNA lysidine(34) synthetase TilS [Sulfurimonas sp.]